MFYCLSSKQEHGLPFLLELLVFFLDNLCISLGAMLNQDALTMGMVLFDLIYE